MNTDPWYTRTEFWVTIATTILGFFGAKASNNQTVQAVGATMSGLAPIVYTWGRGNIKTAQAAANLDAVGKVLAQVKIPNAE